MDHPGIDATTYSNPESAHIDFGYHIDTGAKPEAFDNSTVDPRHIIRLIRQFLPQHPVVSKPKTAECVLPGKNGIVIQNAAQNLESASRHQNGTIHGGHVIKLPIKQDNATDDSTIGTALESEEGSPGVDFIQENGDYAENPGHIVSNGHYAEDNRDLSRKRSRGGYGVEQNGDAADHLTNDNSRSVEKLPEAASVSINLCKAVAGNVEDRTPGTAGVECIGRTDSVDDGAREDAERREEAGCVLWDLAATESHAEFLVESHILDVLQAFLSVPQPDRIREICLGVFGNLACHPGPVKAMVATNGLVQTIVQQLFVDSVPSLTETCRLLSAGLHSDETVAWVESIKPDVVLERIMWMALNTLDSQLLEKCTELILAMVDSRRDAAFVLLPSLLRLGLPGLLTNLIGGELSAVSEGTSTRGDVVLDIVLQIAEVLSISDDSAAQLAASSELFLQSCQVICLSARDEIGPSSITATVLIANLLTEESGLIDRVLDDAIFLGRLLALVPFAADDPGARNALWSILGRICHSLVSTTFVNPPNGTTGWLGVLADGCCFLLDDMEVHQEDDVEEEDRHALAGQNAAASTSRGLQAKLVTVDNLKRIMDQWTAAHRESSAVDTPLARSVRNARSLLKRYASTSGALPGSTGGRESFGAVPNGDVNSTVKCAPSISQVAGSQKTADGSVVANTEA